MKSQMNLVHNAARLAMADHRAATPRFALHKPPFFTIIAHFLLRILR